MTSPLTGKRVIVTRAVDLDDELVSLLRGEGANPIQIPAIKIAPPESWEPVDRAILALQDYDLVIFTSVNGVRFFMDRLKSKQLKWGAVQTAAIGSKTAQEIRKYGIQVNIVPERSMTAEELMKTLAQQLHLKDKRVLFPRAMEGREELHQSLKKEGAKVDVVPVYKTIASEEGKESLERVMKTPSVDWLTFASGSAVHAFFALGGASRVRGWIRSSNIRIAVIGRVTEEAVMEESLSAAAVSSESTFESMIEGMKRVEKEVNDGN